MTKIKNNLLRIGLASVGVLAAMLLIASAVTPAQAATIGSQLSLGSTGPAVTQLQEFLASNSWIYPQGLVTGYYGKLTENAVLQFQAAFDIPQVGNVGPITLAKINSIINSGLGLNIGNPWISDVAVQANNTNATVTWVTNDPTQSQVYYNTSPIVADEATFQYDIPYVSGSLASNTNLSTADSVTLLDLQANTTYYYIVRSIDASGNMSQSTQMTFTTN